MLYPNNTALIELRLIGSQDERECCAISATPYQVAAELRRVADWIEQSEGNPLGVVEIARPGAAWRKGTAF